MPIEKKRPGRRKRSLDLNYTYLLPKYLQEQIKMSPAKIGKNLKQIIFKIKREKIILNYIKAKNN